jgi:hypothetical protein
MRAHVGGECANSSATLETAVVARAEELGHGPDDVPSEAQPRRQP